MRHDDLHAIDCLLSRYAFALDARDADEFSACFAEGSPMTPEFVEKVMQFHGKFHHTIHHVTNRSYRIEGDRASGKAQCIVNYFRKSGDRITKFDAYSIYPSDELTRIDGEWLFTNRKWVPLFSGLEAEVVAGVPDGFWDPPLG